MYLFGHLNVDRHGNLSMNKRSLLIDYQSSPRGNDIRNHLQQSN